MDKPRSIRLADGRRLAFAEFGDPAGAPVVFLHGWGDSRLTRHPDDKATAALGVRLVTVDRPGAGASDFQARRRLVDWPADVAALADELGIERFAVLGWSGGGPHAAACAHALPDRVTRLGIACGFAPLSGPGATRGLPLDLRLGLPLLRHAAWTGRIFFAGVPREFRRDPGRAWRRQAGKRLPPSDQAVLRDAALRANLERGAAEAVRPGAAGLAHELAVLFGRPWGFAPRDVRVPTSLWYGTDDTYVPVSMGRRLAAEIPLAQLTVFPQEGHLLVFTHWREILSHLIRAGDRAALAGRGSP
jgi:pimeloyl-ACP methyl ester carboxylesterase